MSTLLDLWTNLCLVLFFAAFAVWCGTVMYVHGRGFVGRAREFFRRQPVWVSIFLPFFFVKLWGYGSVKSGGGELGDDGGANGFFGMLPLPEGGQTSSFDLQIVSSNETDGSTSVLVPRELTAEDFARGFVMARIGMGERWDFSVPSNATVCADWRAFGAATDWIYLSPPDWATSVGTNESKRLRVFSFGKVQPFQTNATGRILTDTWFAPLQASLGIVPEGNWHLLALTNAPSLFWHNVTPYDSLLLTWQNILLGRLAENPVSFQTEFFPDGRFTYRYDFSRLNADALTNLCVGASFAGFAWTTNALPTNVTSMAFYPLSLEDAIDPDPDGDGLTTTDELFVYGTDPHATDSDLDGLSDFEELAETGTDPLEAHSVSDVYNDAFALKIGDLDPFACPEGSTNTVFEHVFYTGTTNAPFAYPQSSDTHAVLKVSVAGTGAGDLIVGDQVVPLLAPPRTRSTVPAYTLLRVQLVKGETYPVYLRGAESLEISLHSDDFAFGVRPTRHTSGCINFPNTVATTPCIHDFNARRTVVSLPMSRDAELLSCTWWSAHDGKVDVENLPPRMATITGNFSARETSGIAYRLEHPRYLFGQTVYEQTVRFCPQPPEPDPDAPDPWWYAEGEGDDSDTSEVLVEQWCCYWGACDEWCSCNCGCDCRGVFDPEDDADFDDDCPEHGCPYRECASLHANAYTNAMQNAQSLGDILYIREPSVYEEIHLEVPTEHRNCCPCSEHWTNYVGVAYKSYRLRLLNSDGADFSRSESSCDVNLAGVYPSASVGDAKLAFSRNGEIYQQYNKTVLGVAIKGNASVNLAACNALDSSFGLPMTVCTNFWDAPPLRFVTNVKLPDGNIHLELADATGSFTVWYLDRNTWLYRKLLDTEKTPVRDLSMTRWKALMRRATDGSSAELPICIASSATGTVSLVFRYWNMIDGKFVQDEAVQRVTSLQPPLRLDITRDGVIDDDDSAAWFDNRPFYYWVNEDTIKGEHVGADANTAPNASDLVVNGTFDMINFFPMAVDLAQFKDAWGDRVTYELKPEWGHTNSFNFCFADVSWNKAGSVQTTNVITLTEQPLSSAALMALPASGVELSCELLNRFSENAGLMLCEAKSSSVAMRLDVRFGSEILYSYSVPMAILPVKQMYSWLNSRYLSGDSVVRPSEFHSIWDEAHTKSLIFLHGANVDESAAEIWGDIIFKRMWVSGVRADFYNVDWRSNIGGAANYHENASNAFVVASQLAPILSNIPGEKVIMAHSLGNMVVSSMIQDYGLEVTKYFMCNSAVPAEAYDPDALVTTALVHRAWIDYPACARANEWHAFFDDDDDRSRLKWAGRFANVVPVAYNFYSSGDHVLELFPSSNIGWSDGYENADQMYERFSWHRQELGKGRKEDSILPGTTDWSGWGFAENALSAERANELKETDAFKTNTVFKLQPASMNTNSIPILLRGAHLAKGIPTRTPASGATAWGAQESIRRMFNLQSTDVEKDGVARPNGWIARPNGLWGTWGDRWMHSDIKDMSYFYVYRFYQKIKELGVLQ